jgi:hypothetical protein
MKDLADELQCALKILKEHLRRFKSALSAEKTQNVPAAFTRGRNKTAAAFIVQHQFTP